MPFMNELPSGLDRELHEILSRQTVAALGSLQADGYPHVSMVNFAVEPRTGLIVLCCSSMAPQAAHLRADARASLLVLAPGHTEGEGAVARLTLQGTARFPEPGSNAWNEAHEAWLARFPASHDGLDTMLDRALVTLSVVRARQVSSFGGARDVTESHLMPLLLN